MLLDQITARTESGRETVATVSRSRRASGGTARSRKRDSALAFAIHSLRVGRLPSSICITSVVEKTCEVKMAMTGPRMIRTTSSARSFAQPS
jgi:hypothetical protein